MDSQLFKQLKEKSKRNIFHLKTNINSEYQIFWITYEIQKINPDVELTIIRIDNQCCMLSIFNSNLTLTDIQIILMENSIDYIFLM